MFGFGGNGFLLDYMLVRLVADIDDFERKMSKASKTWAGFGQKITTLGQGMSVALTMPLAGLGAATVMAATRMDSLVRGMTAVSGSAAATQNELLKLREVAKLPGLGFREAVEGSVNLQAAGMSADEARRALMAFGNALGTIGKGKAELDRVNYALTQIGSSDKVILQDVRQIQNVLPQMRGAVMRAFGTMDLAEINKRVSPKQFIEAIVKEFEKLPKVTGGLQNAFENIQDSAFRAAAAIGKQLAPAVTIMLDKLTNFMAKMEGARGSTQQWMLAIAATLAVMGPFLIIVGALTTAIATLSAAIGVGFLPLIAVAGPVVLGLMAITAWFIKAKLAALNFSTGIQNQALTSVAGVMDKMKTPQDVLAELGRRRTAAAATAAEIVSAGTENRRMVRGGGIAGAVTYGTAEGNKRVRELTQSFLAQNVAIQELEKTYINLANASGDLGDQHKKTAEELAKEWKKIVDAIEDGVKTLHESFSGVDLSNLQSGQQWRPLTTKTNRTLQDMLGGVPAERPTTAMEQAQFLGFQLPAALTSTSTASQELIGKLKELTKGMKMPEGAGTPIKGAGFFAGIKDTAKRIFDVKQIGSQIAANFMTGGLNMALDLGSKAFNTITTAIFGAGEAAKIAARDFALAANSIRAEIAGMRGDTAQQSFYELQRGVIDRLKSLGIESFGFEKMTSAEQMQQALQDMIASIMRMPEFMRGMAGPLQLILDWLTESMKHLGETVNSLNDSMRNIPTGFKIAAAVFNATSVAPAAAVTPSTTGGSRNIYIQQVDVHGVEDPEEFYDTMEYQSEQQRRRGNTSLMPY